jgi:hypothetical protein
MTILKNIPNELETKFGVKNVQKLVSQKVVTVKIQSTVEFESVRPSEFKIPLC